MPVRFVLGRAGSGKTHYCLTEALAELSRADGPAVVLITPEQASFQIERRLALASPGGGYFRARVLSFSRLTALALDELGVAGALDVGPLQRRLALRGLAARRPDLFAPLGLAVQTEGFFAALDRLIEQLQGEHISPELLAAVGGGGHDAAARRALASVYAGYLDWLGPQRVDAAARLDRVRPRLGELPWLRGARVFVDGFAGFTAAEHEALVAIARLAADMSITLLCEPQDGGGDGALDDLALFHRTQRTARGLRARLRQEGVEIEAPMLLTGDPPRFMRSDALALLERRLTAEWSYSDDADARREPSSDRACPSGARDVRVLACSTHRDELVAAVRWIRRQVAESGGGLHFRDFAVIARDLAPYADLVSEVFEALDTPYFIDRRRSLRSHPLHRLVAAAIDAACGDFDPASMLALLRTRLTLVPRDDAERIENTVARERIRGRDAWTTAWSTGDEQASSASHRRQIVAALAPLADAAAASAPIRGGAIAALLADALTALGAGATLDRWIREARARGAWESAEVHRQAWEAVGELLTAVSETLGGVSLPLDGWSRLIRSSLAEQTIGVAPPTLDQVLVSAIDRSRHPEIRCAWLFAFNEGVFPQQPGEAGLLSSLDIAALNAAAGTSLASPADDALGERLLAYIALTRASRRLVVSFAASGLDGEPLAPSPLLQDVQRAAGLAQIERPTDDGEPTTIRDLASRFLEARRSQRDPLARRRYARLCDALRRDAAAAPALRHALRGLDYDNAPPPLLRPAPAADAPAWRGTVSQLDAFVNCPFQALASHTLRIDPQRGPPPVERALGERAHAAMARAFELLRTQHESPRRAPLEAWREAADAALSELRAATPPDLPRRRPDLAALFDVLDARLRELVEVHAHRAARGEFDPSLLEVRFDPADETAPIRALLLTLPDGRAAHVYGRIDRVDVCPDEAGGPPWLIVYDYKATPDTTRRQWLSGARLQAIAYLLAAMRGGPWRDAKAGGFLLAPLYPDKRALSTDRARSTPADERPMLLWTPRGDLHQAIARRLDRELGEARSPVANLRLKRDGGFDSRCDVRSDGQIDAMLAAAEQTLTSAADRLAAGVVDVAPLVEGATLACRACSFQPLCRFDRAYNRPRAADVVLPAIDAGGGEEDEA